MTRLIVALLCLVLVAAPLVAGAQPAGKVARIGILGVESLPGLPRPWLTAFREGLAELGYLESQNVVLELAEGRAERLPELAAELVRRRVDVIFARGNPPLRAAKQATATIPIVVPLLGAPVECGFVASLAKPGGTVTGGAWIDQEIIGKLVQRLKEIRPTLSRVGMLWDPDNCADPSQLAAVRAAGQNYKVQVLDFPTRSLDEMERALPLIVRGGGEGLIVSSGPTFYQQRRAIADLAKRQRLPVVAALKEFADEGALMTYGPNYAAACRRVAFFVDKILKGAKPGDLPMERPTKFELVINEKTARALGVTIPQSLLMQATDVIRDP